jgi:hypothetical protein
MARKREISPALNASADQYLAMRPPEVRGLIATIRAEKEEGKRSVPSTSLIDKSVLLTPTKRAALLDRIADLVDENLSGRSDMCLQFATLVHLALTHLNIPNDALEGTAIYFSDSGEEIFRWRHAWVRVGIEVIDGNSDSIGENPKVLPGLNAPPYWGPIKGITGRRWREGGGVPPHDDDVQNIWWPELKAWLDGDFRNLP